MWQCHIVRRTKVYKYMHIYLLSDLRSMVFLVRDLRRGFFCR